MRFGFDDNLGLPKNFAEALDCEVFPYHELEDLLEAFTQNKLDALFIPVGTLPYMKNDYSIVAEVTFGEKQGKVLESDFIVKSNNNIHSIEDVISATLGRVNKFCTTSFWAPQIYLYDKTPEKTKLSFKNTNGFQDMLLAVNNGRVDAAMEWSIFLDKNPEIASSMRIVFSLSTLPTPMVIIKNTFPENQKEIFSKKLLSFKTNDDSSFFTHFVKPNSNAISDFLTKIKNAQNHFVLNILE